MGSLQVPADSLNVKPSTSTPLRKVMTSGNYPRSTPSLLPQSRTIKSTSAVSVYAAAALDANNIRRQRSESFVQQRKSRDHHFLHQEQDTVPRAPSQICLSRHSPIRTTTLPQSTSTPSTMTPSKVAEFIASSSSSSAVSSDSEDEVDIQLERTTHGLPHKEQTKEQQHRQRQRESSVSSNNTSSSSTDSSHHSGQEVEEEGAILEGVMIRRAVRPSFVQPTKTDITEQQEKISTSEEEKKPPTPSKKQPKVITSREYWSPPPISSADGSPIFQTNGFHATDDPNVIIASPLSPTTSNNNSDSKKQHFFKLKKSNSSSSNHSLFHFSKRFQNHHHRHHDLVQNSNLVYPPPPVSFGENPETDRYGFKKASQWITLDNHHDFDEQYIPILERRSMKWQQLLEEYEPKLPERSSKVKRYVRKGIPAHLRGRVWFHYSGAEAKMDSNPGVYAKFLGKAEEMGDQNEFADIIARDLHRTFPDNIQFRSPSASMTDPQQQQQQRQQEELPAIISALQRVLSAFSVYSPSIGYCQSLNYIVGMLLLFMNEEEAFWTLVAIVQNILPAGVYDVTMEGSNIDQTVLMMLIWERMPHLWDKLAEKKSSFWDYAADGTSMPTITLVTNHWFLTLFINILPIETVLRVWDCFFYEGASVLFRVALALFKMSETTIMSIDDSLEIFQVIQNMPKKIIDCQMLLDYTFRRFGSLTDITHDDLERRREMCRDRRRSGRIPINTKSRTLPRRPFGTTPWKRKPSANHHHK
ncbi:rab-GTPase-TBC domain-containing protein [Phascolomyces articulosus]|uniref:Rab-GTPase-TBC domain-containing protein n=1 Tax=Phascolomyces articulosus TaxID=60185 RepID=A0AAD5KAJ2_9FUNG|nr:rab-GTPase-TBC domain-containing protein [Phascolomyces articulosus]